MFCGSLPSKMADFCKKLPETLLVTKKRYWIPKICCLLLDLITHICTLVSITGNMSPFTNFKK